VIESTTSDPDDEDREEDEYRDQHGVSEREVRTGPGALGQRERRLAQERDPVRTPLSLVGLEQIAELDDDHGGLNRGVRGGDRHRDPAVVVPVRDHHRVGGVTVEGEPRRPGVP